MKIIKRRIRRGNPTPSLVPESSVDLGNPLPRRPSITLSLPVTEPDYTSPAYGFTYTDSPISAGDMNEAQYQFLEQVLSTRSAKNTAYNAQSKQPCNPGTRVDVLQDIKDWVYDTSDSAQGFLWLTGNPGSGKSAVTASTTQLCRDAGILWAQFFINRNVGGTTDPASYFPSIARQLADHSSHVALAIHNSLKAVPAIIEDISQLQVETLFIDSLKLASVISPKPVVVIIDGLDETEPSRLHYTAEILSNTLVNLPTNIKVFISSRTEDDIQKPFSAMVGGRQVKHLHLDTSSESSIRDVRGYLETNIIDIAHRNGVETSELIGHERIDKVSENAAGLFIWAATAVKFIEDRITVLGPQCLEDILDELGRDDVGDIKLLYDKILNVTFKDADEQTVLKFRRIVGYIIALQEPLDIADIASMLSTSTSLEEEHEIESLILQLRSVLVSGDVLTREAVPRLHRTFLDYITKYAEPRYLVNLGKSNEELALGCLRHMIRLLEIGLPTALEELATGTLRDTTRAQRLMAYACSFWEWHLAQVNTMNELHQESHVSHLPHDEITQSLTLIPLRERGVISSFNSNIILWKTKDGIPINFPSQGHIDRVRSVAFSPDGNQIVSGSSDNTLRLWDVHSREPRGLPLRGHNGSVLSVVFSPNGWSIASGSTDCTVRLWHVEDWRLTEGPWELESHTGPVLCVAFSPDGERLISGSYDMTVCVWDAKTRKRVGEPTKGHSDRVTSVTFSPDGKRVASGSYDRTICLWSVRHHWRTSIPTGLVRFEGHTGIVWSIAFSPDSKYIVSGSSDNTVRLWDASTNKAMGSPFEGHTSLVFSVDFSPDGSRVLSGSYDNTLRLWAVNTGKEDGPPLESHEDRVSSAKFSPDGSKIVSASWDNTVRLWDENNHWQDHELSFREHTSKVTALAVSLDQINIATTASLDNTIRIWNAWTGYPNGPHLVLGDMGVVTYVSFSPDGRKIAGLSLTGNVCIWDMDSRELVLKFSIPSIQKTMSMAFSLTGRSLIVFNINGEVVGEWDMHTNPVQSPLSLTSSFTLSAYSGSHEDKQTDDPLMCTVVQNASFGMWVSMDSVIIRRDLGGLTSISDTRSITSA